MGIRSFAVAAFFLLPSSARADEWFGRDKALHFGVSAALSSSAYAVTTAFDDRRGVALAVGGGVALAAGLAKEGYDALGYGTPSLRDVVWDVLGTAVGLGIAFGVDALVRRDPARPAASSSTPLALVRF